MAKNIVVCSDGTGNTAIKERGTNVFKLYEAIDTAYPTNGQPLQIAIYDDGVGTASLKPIQILGGAFGWGLSRNVKQLYTALAHSYVPGDKLYFFGFSRGAFTVRSLAGFIATVGLVNASHPDLNESADLDRAVSKAYSEFRETFGGLWEGTKKVFRKKATKNVTRYADVPIEFIGVWDTVDAVGLPFDEATKFLNWIFRFKFPDTELSSRVKHARHALSLDDERKTFHPVIWNENKDDNDRIIQIWFAGVHSNVGGGYVKQGMSLISLNWIMDEAERFGLRFITTDRNTYRDHANVHDKPYDSRGGLGVYYRYQPRDIGKLCSKKNVKPKIHYTALERAAFCTEGYAPANWPADAMLYDGPIKINGKNLADICGTTPYLLDDPSYKRAIQCRQKAYLFFLIFSLWIFLAAVTPQANGNYWQVLSSWQISDVLSQPLSTDFLGAFLKTLYQYPLLTVALSITAIVGIRCRKRQQSIASKHWHKISQQIRHGFY